MGKLTYERKGTRTHVYLDGDNVGYIDRQEESNPSPRGGAYRIMHYAVCYIGPRRWRKVACFSRQEAGQWIANQVAAKVE